MDYREDAWRKTLAVGDCVRIQNPGNDAMETFYVKAVRLTKRSERLQVQVNYYGWVSAECLYALVSKRREKQ